MLRFFTITFVFLVIIFSYNLFKPSAALAVCYQRGDPLYSSCMSGTAPKSCAFGTDQWYWCCTMLADACPIPTPTSGPTPVPASPTPTYIPGATATPPPYSTTCTDPVRGCFNCEWNTTNCSTRLSTFSFCNSPYIVDENACKAYTNEQQCVLAYIPCTTVIHNYYCATSSGCTQCPNNVCPAGFTAYTDYAQCQSSCKNLSTQCTMQVQNAHCDTLDACINAQGTDHGRVDCAIGTTCCQLPVDPSNVACDPSGGTNYTGIKTAIGCLDVFSSNTGPIQPLLTYSTRLSAGFALLLFGYAAFTLLTSGGDPKKYQLTKEIVAAVIGGIVFITLSLVLLNFLGANVLQLGPLGFTIK